MKIMDSKTRLSGPISSSMSSFKSCVLDAIFLNVEGGPLLLKIIRDVFFRTKSRLRPFLNVVLSMASF